MRGRVTDEYGGASERPDALVDPRRWTTASGPAELIDVLAGRLSEADALRLARVLHALADAGLIRECHVFVAPAELGGAR
jgi:hypothetical protein